MLGESRQSAHAVYWEAALAANGVAAEGPPAGTAPGANLPRYSMRAVALKALVSACSASRFFWFHSTCSMLAWACARLTGCGWMATIVRAVRPCGCGKAIVWPTFMVEIFASSGPRDSGGCA